MANRLFLFLYILVILMPALRVLDVISSQGLYLNIINFFSTIFILYNTYLIKNKRFNFRYNFLVVSFICFFIWSSITALWAVNQSESLRVISEIFTTILALINVLFHSQQIKINRIHFIFCVLFFMQILEISFLTFDYLKDVLNGIYRPGSMRYLGLTGNKNIASFSVLIKVPVFLYFIYVKNEYKFKFFFRSISYLYFALSFYIIFFVTLTRAAQISYLLLILFFLIQSLRYTLRSKKDIIRKLKPQIKFLLPILLALFFGMNFSKNTTSINENISTAFINQDASTNERIKFYKYAIEIIRDNFFTGTGIGSWELESIEKDRLEMKSYVVPYHVHNDFLEIFSETGVFGFLFLYVPILIIYIQLFISILFNKNNNKRFISLIIFLMLSMYIADALLNFPFARVIQNINLIFIIVLGCYNLKDKFVLLGQPKNFKTINLFVVLLFLITPLSLYSSYRQFSSSRDQSLLLYAFNQNNFKFFTDEELQKIERVYPNLTLTALPISTIIGIHYFTYGDLEKADMYFREGIKANPYLNISKSYLGRVFDKKGIKDSARYYTKKAFENMPHNPVHFAHYVQVLIRDYDTLTIKEAYDYIPDKKKDERFEKLYYLAMSNLLDKDEGRLVLNNVKKGSIEDDGLKKSYYILELGRERVAEGYINYLKAESYFKNNDFSSAAKFYDLAFEKNPLEYPYIENASIAYLRQGKLEKAMEKINVVIDNMDLENVNGKAHYIKGLIYLEMDEQKIACEQFEKALKYNFNSKVALFNYCR